MNNGLLGKIFAWGTTANYDDTTVGMWLGGLALVLVFAFLWSLVLRDVFAEVKSI